MKALLQDDETWTADPVLQDDETCAADLVISVTQVRDPAVVPQAPICPCDSSRAKHWCTANDVVVDKHGAIVRLEFFETCVDVRHTGLSMRCCISKCQGVDIIPLIGGYMCIMHAAEYMEQARRDGLKPGRIGASTFKG